MVLSFLKKRSKIIEIVAAHDIVFALAQSGICAAFSRGRTLMNDQPFFCLRVEYVAIFTICFPLLKKGPL